MSRHATIQVRPMKCRGGGFRWTAEDPQIRCATHGAECPNGKPLAQRPHYLRLVAANGAVLAHSEVYANRRNARRAVRAWTRAFYEVMEVPPGCGDVVEFDADGNEVAR